MGTPEVTSQPQTPVQDGLMMLGEVACRYRVGDIRPEELPMVAAEAIAAGLDTPTLCELAGWPRTAPAQDIRDAFEQALAESGIELPDPVLARRHALRRLAARLVAGDLGPTDLATGEEWWETEVETAEERAFVALIPQCTCCLEFELRLDRRSWEAALRAAALALASSAPVGPGC
ncbi:hypothetical protein [Kitasatospora camelliae]|uniref:Uncharacterized protein n=1 Tax=Kitasatospora camelliae TaxID=3156397 RepID=A0AAU8JPT7_9ACTN